MFTEMQKAQIRSYLGWPALFLQVYSALEYSMQAVETKPDTFELAVSYLNTLIQIDAAIQASYIRIQAVKVDGIEIDHMSEINILRNEGKRYVGRLAAIMNVGIREDSFAGNARTTRGNSNYLTIV